MELDDVKEAPGKAATIAGEQVQQLRDRRRRARRRLEEIFSREVLGAVLVSLAAGKVVEQLVVIVAPWRPLRLVAWFVAFWLFVGLFVYWDRVAARAKETVEAAAGEE